MNAINLALVCAIVALAILIVIFVWVVSPMQVVGTSMYPTLHPGDRVWVQKIGFDVTYGDIVVFERDDSGRPPIKRIVAMEGDVIRFDMQAECWYLNGERLDEPYLSRTDYNPEYMVNTDAALREQLTGEGLSVGQGELFVLGDNRNDSYDSHNYGCIRVDWIKGKARC